MDDALQMFVRDGMAVRMIVDPGGSGEFVSIEADSVHVSKMDIDGDGRSEFVLWADGDSKFRRSVLYRESGTEGKAVEMVGDTSLDVQNIRLGEMDGKMGLFELRPRNAGTSRLSFVVADEKLGLVEIWSKEVSNGGSDKELVDSIFRSEKYVEPSTTVWSTTNIKNRIRALEEKARNQAGGGKGGHAGPGISASIAPSDVAVRPTSGPAEPSKDKGAWKSVALVFLALVIFLGLIKLSIRRISSKVRPECDD